MKSENFLFQIIWIYQTSITINKVFWKHHFIQFIDPNHSNVKCQIISTDNESQSQTRQKEYALPFWHCFFRSLSKGVPFFGGRPLDDMANPKNSQIKFSNHLCLHLTQNHFSFSPDFEVCSVFFFHLVLADTNAVTLCRDCLE